jgi:Flp pilus assembly protein TadG
MKSKLLKKRSGQMIVTVTLFIMVVVFAFSALVVDASVLYSERRKLVTAVDAAALAGSQIMMEGMRDKVDNTVEAINVAKQVALNNKIPNSSIIDVKVTKYDSNTGKNSSYFGRDIIVVTAKTNNKNIFAGLFGRDTSEVFAKAIATWGFTQKFEASQFIPLFAFDYEFEEAIDNKADRIDLHQGPIYINGENNPPNRDFVTIGNGLSDIKLALAGKLVGDTLELGTNLSNQTGQGNTIINEIEKRMMKASEFENENDKVRYMTGVIPIINSEKFLANIENTDGDANLELPIEGFAVMRILDVIVDGSNANKFNLSTGKGSEYSELNYPIRNIRKEYNDYWIDIDSGLKAGYNMGTVIGIFTDHELIEVWSVVQDGDQQGEEGSEYFPPYYTLIE